MDSLLELIEPYTDYKVFMKALEEYEMVVGNVFKGWMGLDCKLSVVLIHLSQQHMEGKKTHLLKGIDRREVLKVYQIVWAYYQSVCQEAGLKFTPSVLGLSTILNSRKT
jgi:hypothetical protein